MIKNFDPRLKILIVMVLSSVSFVMTSEVILSFYYLIAVSLFLIIGAFKKGSGVFIYALGLFGVGKFFVPICPLSAGALLDVALFFLKRMSLIFVMLMWLQTNMKTGHFIATVQKLKIPKGMIITIAVILRYRPTLKIELSEIKMAMKLRGVNFSLKNILRRPLATLEYSAVPIIMRSIAIGDQLSISSMTRGLDLETQRGSYVEARIRVHELVLTILIILLILFSLTISKRVGL